MEKNAVVNEALMDFQQYNFNPKSIPPAHAEAIGRVCVSASHTEYVLDTVIAALAKLGTFEEAIISANLNIPQREGIIRSLADYVIQDEDTKLGFMAAMTGVRKAFERRNAIVHAGWAVGETTGGTYRVSVRAKTGLVVKLEPYSVEMIIEVADVIYDAGIVLHEFMTAAKLW